MSDDILHLARHHIHTRIFTPIEDISKNELVFIEVKTRTSLKYGSPIDAVNTYKQNHLFKACEYYLYKHKLHHLFVRVDVIEIFIKDNLPYIHHVKQIF